MAEMRAGTRYAKQVFLYGNGDGVPVRNVVKLSEMTGVHENTIRAHLAEWEKESQEIIANSSDLGLALTLSSETLEENKKDLAFIRDKMNSLRFEVDHLDEIIASLEEIVENFSINSENGDKAVRLFENYLRGSMNRRSLLTLFLSLKKEWDTKSAIDGLRDVALTREKEMSKGRAKLAIKELEQQGQPKTVRPLENSVFARSSTPPKLQFSEDVDEE